MQIENPIAPQPQPLPAAQIPAKLASRQAKQHAARFAAQQVARVTAKKAPTPEVPLAKKANPKRHLGRDLAVKYYNEIGKTQNFALLDTLGAYVIVNIGKYILFNINTIQKLTGSFTQTELDKVQRLKEDFLDCEQPLKEDKLQILKVWIRAVIHAKFILKQPGCLAKIGASMLDDAILNAKPSPQFDAVPKNGAHPPKALLGLTM